MSDKTKQALVIINEVIINALLYKDCPLDRVNIAIKYIDYIVNNPRVLKECETHLKSPDLNLLFYISNIIYNLKTKNDLVLTPDVLRWLCTVWRNFLIRNKSYQELFPTIDEYRINFKVHYPGIGSYVQQLKDVNKIKEEYLTDYEIDDSPLAKLHSFQQQLSEVLNWMRPTYYFLLDFYYERELMHNDGNPIAINLDKEGLASFGQDEYTYEDLLILLCQGLGILETLYLIVKKKKSSRRIINIDGKQKFLSTPEIYNIYMEKFNAARNELSKVTGIDYA